MTVELLLTGVGLSICALVLLFYLPQRRFVFSPSYYPNRDWFRQQPNYHLHELSVAPNTNIEIVCYEPDQAEQTILYFGGKEQDSVGLVQKLAKEYPQVRWIASNYRGYGKSQGRATEKTLLADSLLLFDWAKKRFGSTSLMGFSLGSSVAAYVASKRSLEWLVLVAPFDSVQSLIQAKAAFVPGFLIRYKLPTIQYVGNITCPVYVYNSINDEIVAPCHVELLRKKIPLLADAQEFSGYSHDGLLFSPELKLKLNEIFHPR